MPCMARGFHHFVLEFRRGVHVATHPFLCGEDAEAGAKIVARLSGGGMAIEAWGDPEAGQFGEAEVLSVEGQVCWIDLDWAVRPAA